MRAVIPWVFALALLSGRALAQTIYPSKVTPELPVAADHFSSSDALLETLAGADAPPGADDLEITIGTVEIQGGFLELNSESAALAKPIEGRRVSVAAIYEFADKLQQAYANKGFTLVRVSVPPQRLSPGGPVKLAITDGFIERVDLQGVSRRVRAVIATRTKQLLGRHHVTSGEIERIVLIAGDMPGLNLQSALARGQQPGGVTLVLAGSQHLVTGTLGVDNGLPGSLGRWQAHATLAANSLSGAGEEFYVSLASGFPLRFYGSPRSPLKIIGAGAILPIGQDGFTLTGDYNSSRTRPAVAPGTPNTVGNYRQITLQASFPVIRSRQQTLNMTAALDGVDQSLDAPQFGQDINRDAYAAVRTGLNGQAVLPWNSAIVASSEFSQGLGGRDAAKAAADRIPLSRQGSAPNFSALSAYIHIIQRLPAHIEVNFVGYAQTSFSKPLFVPEEFSLDGADRVSSCPTGTFTVDSGETVRAELSYAIDVPENFIAMNLSPYVFAAQGSGWLYQPTVLERAWVDATAFGLGTRVTLVDPEDSFAGATLSVEFGQQFSETTARHRSSRLDFVFTTFF